MEDCISCHVEGTLSGINTTAFGQGIHVNINTTDGVDVVSNNDCWMCHYQKNMDNVLSCINCHVVQSNPVTDTNRHNITSTPSLYKINGTSVVEITDCTICHDSTVYSNSIANFNRDAVADCDYCHTYPDKNRKSFY